MPAIQAIEGAEAVNQETIFREDQGKPDAAVPVTNECASPGAFNSRGAYPLPSTNSKPDAELIAAALVPDNASGGRDCWPASARALLAAVLLRHWRDQADGFFE